MAIDRRAFLGTAALTALAGCVTPGGVTGGGAAPKNNTTESAVATAEPDIRLVWDEYERAPPHEIVRGEVENTTDRHFDYVDVRVTLYDEDGWEYSSGMDTIENFRPLRIAGFEAVCEASFPDKYDHHTIEVTIR